MRTANLTDRGRRRPTNEDSVRTCDDLNFFMIADGVGGNRSGEIASQSALDALEKFIRHNPPEWLGSREEIFRYFRAAGIDVESYIGEKYKDGVLPCRDKREGKRLLALMRKELIP